MTFPLWGCYGELFHVVHMIEGCYEQNLWGKSGEGVWWMREQGGLEVEKSDQRIFFFRFDHYHFIEKSSGMVRCKGSYGVNIIIMEGE